MNSLYCNVSLATSSAQLLEPFKLEHGIGAVGRAMSGSGAMPELERVQGATPSIMTQGVLGATTELEDPPGLYEKVDRPHGKVNILSFLSFRLFVK